MFVCRIMLGVSLCTMLFIIYTNAIEYGLMRIRRPCTNRRNIHPLLIKHLALKKYYDDYVRGNLMNANQFKPEYYKMESQADVTVKPVVNKIEDDSSKALRCAKLLCSAEELGSPVCACNHVTGHVATFKDECDLKRHNCRYDTVFKVILHEICPWEYQFRRKGGKPVVDYSDPKYYNHS